MTAQKLLAMLIFASLTLPMHAQANDPIEPNAGNWLTWVISSGRDYRVPPPPGAAETQAELRVLADLIHHNDVQDRSRLRSGMPAHQGIAGSI